MCAAKHVLMLVASMDIFEFTREKNHLLATLSYFGRNGQNNGRLEWTKYPTPFWRHEAAGGE